MPAHDLAEILEGRAGLDGDLLASLSPVLVEKSLGIHSHTIFAKSEDSKRGPRIASVRELRSNPPMDVKAIRRKNLERLKNLEGTFDAIGNKAEVDPNYLSQINTGYRQMGDAIARRIESAYGHPHGWMDTLHEPENFTGDSNVEPITRTLTRVPLVSWVAAGQPGHVFDPYQPGAAERWEEIEATVSKHAYALRVRGDSMIAPDGQGFPDGSTIIVDPSREPKNGDYVIVRFPNSDEATFKKYVVDGPNRILKALNPAYPPITVKTDAVISGVVTELILRKSF